MTVRHLHVIGGLAVMAVVCAVPAAAQQTAKDILAREASGLVEILKNPNAPVFEKAKACQRLAVVGSKEAIPQLADLLNDENLNLYARFALEGIPDPAVDETLRNAAVKLRGRQLVGVVNSMGQRRDERAVELLQKLLEHDDEAVAKAAARSLGSIGNRQAGEILSARLAQGGPLLTAVADGALACADLLAATGNQPQALALYKAIASADVPQHLKLAALQGQFRVKPAEGKDLVIEQLRASDEALFQLGLALAGQLPGDSVTKELVGELKALAPERQALLLRVLGKRGDAPSMEVLRSLSGSESPAVREAVIRVASKSASPEAVDMLLEAAGRNDDLAKLAVEGLKNRSGADADAAIVARLAKAKGAEKLMLFELAGTRRIATATPVVESALQDTEEKVRVSAIIALGQLVPLDNLQILIQRALADDGTPEATAAKDALRTAALRMGDREAAAAVLVKILTTSSTPHQVYLLDVLGKMGGRIALEAVASAAKSQDAELKEAATRVLGEWPDAEAAPVLLNIAQSDPEAKYQVRALRGYLRIARQLQVSDETRVEMFRTTLDIARRDEEKQLAFDILTRIPSPQTLEMAASYLQDPTLTKAAADAAIKIAPKVVNADPKSVVSAMQKVLGADVGREMKNRARLLIAQAGGAG